MVYLADLWLPIVVSAVIVFFASSILHMVLPLHRNDYKKMPNEDKVLESLRNLGVPPGRLRFPMPRRAQGYEVTRNVGKIQGRSGWNSDGTSERPSCHGQESDSVVCLLPRHGRLCGLSHWADRRRRRRIHGGIPCFQHHRVSRLRRRPGGRFYLEGRLLGALRSNICSTAWSMHF